MRILLLSSEFPPLGGGVARKVERLLHEYGKFPELEFDVITADGSKARTWQVAGNIRVHTLDIKSPESLLHHQRPAELVRYARKALALARHLHAQRSYDGVHAFATVPAGYVAWRLRLPYVVSLSGSDVPWHNPAYFWHYVILTPFIKLIWRKAKIVVANSQDLQEEVAAVSSVPTSVIPGGVDTTFFSPPDQRPESSGMLRLLFVGRLHPVKNIDVALRGLALLPSNMRTNVVFDIVGDGSLRQSLEQLVAKLDLETNVRFFGLQTKEQLRSHYHAADALVLISEREGMSNALLEAMASGLPVIASDTGGARELLSECGIITNTTPEAFAASVQQCIDNPAKLVLWGHKARERSLGYTWSAIVHERIDLYQKIFSEGN